MLDLERGERDGEGLERVDGVAEVEGEGLRRELAELEGGVVRVLARRPVVEDVLGVDEEVLRRRRPHALPAEVEAQAAELLVPGRELVAEAHAALARRRRRPAPVVLVVRARALDGRRQRDVEAPELRALLRAPDGARPHLGEGLLRRDGARRGHVDGAVVVGAGELFVVVTVGCGVAQFDEKLTPQSVTVQPVEDAKSEAETLLDTHHPRSWSKAAAPSNIQLMSVTEDVSQAPMSWLKAPALKNMAVMSVTADVSQAPMSWSKAAASSNMEPMFVTADVSQPLMSSLKAEAQ